MGYVLIWLGLALGACTTFFCGLRVFENTAYNEFNRKAVTPWFIRGMIAAILLVIVGVVIIEPRVY